MQRHQVPNLLYHKGTPQIYFKEMLSILLDLPNLCETSGRCEEDWDEQMLIFLL